MSALLSTFWPYIAAALSALVVMGGAYLQGRSDSSKIAAAQREKEQLAAADERLEMDREATAAERKAAGMTDAQAKEEALKWARPSS